MKVKSLQLEKAMSAALFVLLLSVVGMKNALAQTQVATLQHGDSISAFYGADAFVNAHTAAVDGDIVTLSSGTYNTTTITKAITLRGAGVATNSETGSTPTRFSSAVSFNVTNTSIPLKIEGVLFTNTYYSSLANPIFTRCNFNSFDASNYNSSNILMTGAQFVNCMVNIFSSYCANNTTFINSVVWNPKNIVGTHSVVLYNSIFGSPFNERFGIGIYGVYAYNSVIVKNDQGDYNYCYRSENSFINCIGIKLASYPPFGSGYTSGCITRTSYEAVFESFTGNFSFEEPFILKENIATGFLGTDGTQVGLYGGFVPYSNRPSYMKIEHCNVANRSTIDGKLSVDIEVVTEGE